MSRVLVTGAAGVMGVRLVERLLAHGFEVRALVLPRDRFRARLEGLGCDIREGDIGDATSLTGVCQGVDTVYHLAAVILSHDPNVFERVNRAGTAHLVTEAQRAGVRHFVYVSSASVVYPKRTPYAESKLQAEALVKGAQGLDYTIVRPTLVYERGGGQEIQLFLEYLKRFPIVPFIGRGEAIKRPVWSEDVVTGLARLAGNPVALGKTYNFSGPEPITMLELAHLLLETADRSRAFVRLPVWLCVALAHLLRVLFERPPLTLSAVAGIVNDADLDPTSAMRDLGYAPIGVREGIRRCFSRQAPALPATVSDALGAPFQKRNAT
ncbi:MAG TPA: NAD-dependent epimerase/dehydratase family protein [Polyangiaceae bacterium]|nr:NAD-dependent epimerase/dehydratase family protein [Polyangiaceae bacterium]